MLSSQANTTPPTSINPTRSFTLQIKTTNMSDEIKLNLKTKTKKGKKGKGKKKRKRPVEDTPEDTDPIINDDDTMNVNDDDESQTDAKESPSSPSKKKQKTGKKKKTKSSTPSKKKKKKKNDDDDAAVAEKKVEDGDDMLTADNVMDDFMFGGEKKASEPADDNDDDDDDSSDEDDDDDDDDDRPPKRKRVIQSDSENEDDDDNSDKVAPPKKKKQKKVVDAYALDEFPEYQQKLLAPTKYAKFPEVFSRAPGRPYWTTVRGKKPIITFKRKTYDLGDAIRVGFKYPGQTTYGNATLRFPPARVAFTSSNNPFGSWQESHSEKDQIELKDSLQKEIQKATWALNYSTYSWKPEHRTVEGVQLPNDEFMSAVEHIGIATHDLGEAIWKTKKDVMTDFKDDIRAMYPDLTDEEQMEKFIEKHANYRFQPVNGCRTVVIGGGEDAKPREYVTFSKNVIGNDWDTKEKETPKDAYYQDLHYTTEDGHEIQWNTVVNEYYIEKKKKKRALYTPLRFVDTKGVAIEEEKDPKTGFPKIPSAEQGSVGAPIVQYKAVVAENKKHFYIYPVLCNHVPLFDAKKMEEMTEKLKEERAGDLGDIMDDF